MSDRPDDPLPSPTPKRDAGEDDEETAGWYHLAGLGLEFVGGVVALGWLGWFLDGRWGTRPWLMIVGGVIGFAAGLWMLIRSAVRAFKD